LYGTTVGVVPYLQNRGAMLFRFVCFAYLPHLYSKMKALHTKNTLKPELAVHRLPASTQALCSVFVQFFRHLPFNKQLITNKLNQN
jgi:hypothetical protein